jgi:hypothetical protein
MQRLFTALIALWMIAAIGGAVICCAEDDGDDCCGTISCSICSHNVSIADQFVAPLPLSRDARVVVARVISPESPDLARLTPPPIS